MAKRPCYSSPSDHPLTINSSPRSSKPDNMDRIIESFLGLSDEPTLSLDLSLDRLLQSRVPDSNQEDMIERALKLGSVLVEAGKRSARNRAWMHNAVAWPLSPDLTIKVFSMLDTKSVCYAAATCSFFHKWALDPFCYGNIDLTTAPGVNDEVVSTMIQRAGEFLRSLKLGIVPGPTASPGSSRPFVHTIVNNGDRPLILTRSCLSFLSGNSGAPGALLRRLQLYNIGRMDDKAFCAALSACPSLLDLEIVGLRVGLRQTLDSVSNHCCSIERLFFESSTSRRLDSLTLEICNALVNNCPNLTSLALRGFMLHDDKVHVLVKGFHKLKYVDISASSLITGAFLRNLGGSEGGNQLEVLILRDCRDLTEVEVLLFLTGVLAGDWKLLRHLDISNRKGLASEESFHRCYSTSFIPVEQLWEERPGFCLLAEFPTQGSPVENEQIVYSSSSEDSSDDSSIDWGHYAPVDIAPLMPASHVPIVESSSSESSYNSDSSSSWDD